MSNSICPWWLGYSLINPLRGLIHNPEKILNKYIRSDMKVLDIGAGMGYFTLPMARLVSNNSSIIAVDMQEKMLNSLKKRAVKAEVASKIETRLCSQNSLGVSEYAGTFDFVLAFAVVHEVPDKDRLFSEIYQALKPGGIVLFAEPKGHVKEESFASSLKIAEKAGLTVSGRPVIGRSLSVVLRKESQTV